MLTPVSLRNAAAQAEFAAFGADVAVVAAYGLILPRPILESPKFGAALNLHGSLLPRWRGARRSSARSWPVTPRRGVGLMGMEEGLDTGPVAREGEHADSDLRRRRGRPDDPARPARRRPRTRESGRPHHGRLMFRPQPEDGVTYAAKIDKAETAIDWTRDAATVRGHINGLSPAPGAYSEVEIDGRRERIKFLRAEAVDAHGPAGTLLDKEFVVACGSGAIPPSRPSAPARAR